MSRGLDSLPVADAVNILILFHGPVSGDISHAEFLTLIDKWSAGLKAKEYGKELCACFPKLGSIDREAAYGSWLVVVFEI